MPSANFLTLDSNGSNSTAEDALAVERYMNLLNAQDQDSFGGPASAFPLEPFASAPGNAGNFNLGSYMMAPYSTNKMTQQQSAQHANPSSEFRSLQNSPYYSHHQQQQHGNGGPSTSSPGNSVFQSLFPQGGEKTGQPRAVTGGTGPFRELFTQNASAGISYHDRLHYYTLAQKYGFIVGAELERIKENSRRSMNQTYGRISAYFRNRYGETEAKTKASYLQLGVRVPSKDHVSEIVGKGGQKIKLIREETGALITTPGEHEDHVFIIEAPPEIALSVADHLAKRAREITQSKQMASEKRRGSAGSNPGTPNSAQVHRVPSHGCLVDDHVSLPGSPANGQSAMNGSGSMNFDQQQQQQQMNGGAGESSSLYHSMQPASTFHSSGMTGQAGGRVLLARGRISVPQDLVGKIIGTQGSIITTIQKDTGTEIKSPPKETGRGPNATADFEISAYQSLGLSSTQAAEIRVQQAKQLIGHLVMRQLERRTSDDLMDEAGLLPPMSLMDGGAQPQWMWPDVTQMESSEAREVLDRILAESKNKTRRAKEMAGGSSSTPNTPGGPNGSGGGAQTPDVFCEASMMPEALISQLQGPGSMLRTMSHPMSGCYDGGMHEQPSKSGTEIWIQNAMQSGQQQQQKKHSTASLHMPTQMARGVAEGCVDYHKSEWAQQQQQQQGQQQPASKPKSDLSQLLESMMLKESAADCDPTGEFSSYGAAWNGNASFGLDFNKNNIYPISSSQNSAFRQCAGEGGNAFTQSMIDKLFHQSSGGKQHQQQQQDEFGGSFPPLSGAEAWARTPTDVAATPIYGKQFVAGHVGAIGEGRRRSTTANPSTSGSDESPGEAN